MPLATYTCTVYKNNSPKYLQEGVCEVNGQIMWTATSTVGDVAFLAKVPHGAKIVDLKEYHTTGASTQVLEFGFSKGVAAGGGGSISVLISNGAQATRNSMLMNRAAFPLQISMSDLDPVRYCILQAQVVSGTTTTSLIVNFSLQYRFDGPDTR